MVIWLRSDRRGLEPDASRVGVHGDVVPRDAFGALMQIDEAYAQLAADLNLRVRIFNPGVTMDARVEVQREVLQTESVHPGGLRLLGGRRRRTPGI